MSIEFKLPDLGENIAAGDIVSVLVREGDVLSSDQNVLEVETGKATVELPCPFAGRVIKIHVQPGQSVPVGGTLMTIDSPASAPLPVAPQVQSRPPAPAPVPPASVPARPANAAANVRSPEPAPREVALPVNEARVHAPPPAVAVPNVSQESGGSRAPAGPATRRLARELGLDLQSVAGSGPGGRITEEDVKSAVRHASVAPAEAKKAAGPNTQGVESEDAYGKVRLQPLSAIRRTIAVNMARSAQTIPHVTNFDDADITELDHIRKGSMADYVGSEVKLTMMAFVIKAVAHALKLHPTMNASLDLEQGQVIYKEYVNLGVAVDTERGLVVPVIPGVDRLNIPQIAATLAELATKARANRFTPQDLRGGSFTISNLGAIGGTYSTPIINHPEVAILLTGRSRRMPVVVEDQVQIRLLMPLSLSYDHRLVDGAVAARFLNEVKNYLQVPGRLLLAP